MECNLPFPSFMILIIHFNQFFNMYCYRHCCCKARAFNSKQIEYSCHTMVHRAFNPEVGYGLDVVMDLWTYACIIRNKGAIWQSRPISPYGTLKNMRPGRSDIELPVIGNPLYIRAKSHAACQIERGMYAQARRARNWVDQALEGGIALEGKVVALGKILGASMR